MQILTRFRYQFKRIKFRLLLFATIMSIVPLLALAGHNLYCFNKNMKVNLQNQQALVTTRIASEVNRIITEVQKTLEVLIAYQDHNLLCKCNSKQENMLYAVMKEMPSAESLTLVDAFGQEITRVSRYDVFLREDSKNIFSTKAFQAIRRGKSYYGSVRLGSTNQPVFTIAFPIKSENCIAGGLIATVSFRDIMDRLTSEAIANGSYIFMVDEDGELIGHQDFSQVLKRRNVKNSLPSNYRLYQKPSATENITITREYISYTDQKVLGTYSPVRGTGWAIVVEQPVKKAFAPFNNMLWFLGAGTGIIIILVLLISFIFGLKFSRNLEKLEDGVNKVAGGQFGYQLPVPGDNEIGNVVRAFNKFSRELKKKREMEENMREVDKMAALGLLASSVAHEVNNPLSTILFVVEDLLDRLKKGKKTSHVISEDELIERLVLVQEQINRCSKITRGLLGFSRHKSVKKEWLCVNDVINDILKLLKFQFEKRNIRLEKFLSSELPLVYLDVNGLQQVIFNIITNAVDAVERDGVITVTSNYLATGWIEVRVRDNGPGIEEEKLKHVFEPFYTTKPSGKGTGLGLAICRELVTRWGGRIEIDSKPGEGTEITILIPSNYGEENRVREV